MAFPYNFVVCSPDKKHFEINGQPWYFSGANWYDPRLKIDHSLQDMPFSSLKQREGVLDSGASLPSSKEKECTIESIASSIKHCFLACSYYLMTRAADLALRHEVTEVLDAAVTCGLTAIR